MRCLGCEYPIHDITTRVCPECGRSFDPDDPSSFTKDEKEARFQRWAWQAAWVIATSPVLAALLAVALYFLAWMMLGRRPRPNLDDPKYIPVVGWFAEPGVWILLLSIMAGSILVVSLSPFVLLDRETPGKFTRARVTWLWASAVVCMAIFWIPATCVPAFGEVIGWLMD